MLTTTCAGRNFTPTIHHDAYPAIDPTKQSFDNQHVFITGASKGIGRAAAIAYAKAGAAAISLGARSDLSVVEKEVQKAAADVGRQPPKILKMYLDIQSRESVEAAAKKVEECCGSLDVLVNNAGYLEKFLPIAESDPDDWWKTWEIVSPFPRCCLKQGRVTDQELDHSEYPRHLPHDSLLPASPPQGVGENDPQHHICRSTWPQLWRKRLPDHQISHAPIL